MSRLSARRTLAASALILVVAAACGPASTTNSGVSTPTTIATAAPPVTPTAPPAPTAAPLAATTPASATADPVTLVLDPSRSKASYHAHEQLVGRTLPSEAVGTTTAVSGSIALTTDGQVAPDQSTITVDLSKLTSDESRRDNFIKGSTLQTNRFPMATFVARQVQGLPTPLPTSGTASFQLIGDLTVHGVTRPVTWDVTAQFGAADVSGDATTSVKITDFGMNPPKAGPVLSIEDGLTLELAFTATRQA